MPEPRPLGNLAKHLLNTVITHLLDNQDGFFDAVVRVNAAEPEDAVRILRDMAARNQGAVRALTLLNANKHREAEDILIDLKTQLRRERP